MTRGQELLFAAAIGAAGGWVISTAPAWMHASSYEHWWDIATAIGTAGAAIAASVGLWHAVRSQSMDVRLRAWYALDDALPKVVAIDLNLERLERIKNRLERKLKVKGLTGRNVRELLEANEITVSPENGLAIIAWSPVVHDAIERLKRSAAYLCMTLEDLVDAPSMDDSAEVAEIYSRGLPMLRECREAIDIVLNARSKLAASIYGKPI